MAQRTHYAITVPEPTRRRLDALHVALGTSRTRLTVRAIEALEQSLTPGERARLADAKRLIAAR